MLPDSLAVLGGPETYRTSKRRPRGSAFSTGGHCISSHFSGVTYKMSNLSEVPSKKRPKMSEKAMSYNDALRSGQEAYAEGNHEAALKYFNTACRTSQSENTQNQLQALDSKCSVLVKLERLDVALDTAKMMIRADKQNARGYCRCASIEKMRGNLAAAIKFLEHGKTRVHETDKLYQHLVGQLEKLQEASREASIIEKPVDPIAVLPLELLQMIIALIEYGQVVLMTRVSRTWKSVLCRLEPLINTLDFRKAKKPISHLMLKAALDRTLHPRALALGNIPPNITWQVLKAFNHPHKFRLLENLSLDIAKMSIESVQYERFALRSINIGMNCEVGIGHVFSILNKCQMLSHATFKRVKISPIEDLTRHESLQVLEIGNAFDLSAFSIPPLCFSHYPNLRSLTVNGAAVSARNGWDLSSNQELRHLDTYASVIRSIQLPVNLERWLWDGTEVAQFVNTRETLAAAVPLPNLHTLCLSGDNTRAVLKYLHASQIQQDQIKRVGLHNRQGVDVVRGSSPEFEFLGSARDLSLECEALQDQDVDHFMSRFPDISTLQLAAPRITGAFIADLLKRPSSQLCKLILKDCRNVSPDTITWARARGIEVEVHLGKVEVRGGRRLREGWF